MSTSTLTTWKLDLSHSELLFKVRHLVITTVTGQFNNFEATFEAGNEDFTDAKIDFKAEIDSISTGDANRDGHLKSPDFFDAASHPQLTFTSSALTKNADGTYTLTGNLTLHGVTQEVTLDAELGGTVVDPYGQHKVGFELTGKINRKDFGLEWDAFTEAGGAVVSNEVKIAASVQFVKQA